jgi:hypothetical protein
VTPTVPPFIVTSRTGKRNLAGYVPVVGWFVAACHGHRLSAKSKGGFWGGVTGLAEGCPNFRCRAALSNVVVLLIGRSGCRAGQRGDAPRIAYRFPSRKFRGLWRVALPLHFLLNAHAGVLSNLRLS